MISKTDWDPTSLPPNAESTEPSGRRLGPRRLGLVLSLLGGGHCALLMGLVLLIYGVPHNPVWWAIMAIILVGAVAGPHGLLPVVDWVIDGYRRDLAR